MKILNFILALFLLATSTSFAQQKELKKRPKRADNFIRMDGIRVGLDLTRPLQHIWQPGDVYGTELSFDMELMPNFFPVLETGWEKMKINHDYVDYDASGTYTRIGFDYNFLAADHKDDKDIIFIGMRYSFDFARQQVKSYKIENYWGEINSNFRRQNFNAQWVEILLGIKGEILPNIFLGWTVRGKIKTAQKELDMPPVYFNPGYGKADKNFRFDFSYSVFYTLPFDFRSKVD
ncbi:DUF6048 family protein [Sunxiuqinia sp. A32]|uniref:DUF6048 family protein n=1 Tax=Sunxiuqinia sp. A32 TaxID=3461496 RepID=UPI0040462CBC